MSTSTASLFFLSPTISYTIILQKIHDLINFFGNFPLICLGLILTSITCLIIAPISFLPYSYWTILSGIIIMGINGCFIIVPSFIELNTPLPDIVGNEGLKVVQSADSSSSLDSIKLSFKIPYQRGLRISVCTNPGFGYFFQSKREFVIPKTVKSFSFTIFNEQIKPHTVNCLFYGAIDFNPLRKYQIEENTNHISIEIPALDDSFFERFFLEGDYARVSENTITWKGEVFHKK